MCFVLFLLSDIDKKLDTPGFAKLMQVVDPLQYLGTEYESRLSIPKYIINASGDDFYVPDNADFYYDKLPGIKALRVAANSSHYGITAFSEQSLITFVNRLQQSTPMPQVDTNIGMKGEVKTLTVNFSETPEKVVQWVAINAGARDFRYACDVRYTAFPLAIAPANTFEVALIEPEAGWQATFVEATFNDGFVATTQVYVLPQQSYPTTAPPTSGAICKTLLGRKPIAVVETVPIDSTVEADAQP
ncbi:hypothetical protein CBW53_00035 [Yersinia frederiksenii]|nr:hypothetical protein CBW53_00035 [Yersinia frederiksenii]